jgi:hypothetical protein
MANPTDLQGMLTSQLLQPQAQAAIPSTYEQRMLQHGADAARTMRRGMGALTGSDTRTTAEKAQAMMANLDINDPNDQPKILQLVNSINPAQAPKLVAAFAQQKRQRDEKQSGIDAKNTSREKFAEYLDRTYPNKGYGALALQGLITPANMKNFIKEAKEAKDYAVVGNSVYIPSTGKFIKGPTSSKAGTPQKEYNPETNENELVWRDAQDPKIVLQRSPVAKAEDGEMSDADKRRTMSNRDLITTERATETMATDLADSYEGMLNKVNSGFYKSIEEGLKEILGRQDKITEMYLAADRLRVGRGVKNLPVGPASDKDVALVMKGELPANASPEAIISYARGIAKLARITKQDAMLENSWYDLYGDARGFSSYSEKERLEESFAGFPSGAIAELESNMSDETIKEFNAAFNVDYLDMRERLKRSNKILDELDRGF